MVYSVDPTISKENMATTSKVVHIAITASDYDFNNTRSLVKYLQYLSSRKMMVRLVLTEVTQKYFTTFHFVASNDVNTTTHNVHLRQSQSSQLFL